MRDVRFRGADAPFEIFWSVQLTKTTPAGGIYVNTIDSYY
jgi:hypothetical protein